jgi:uncharacterized protein YprB with RNaseH-like and TPR domain
VSPSLLAPPLESSPLAALRARLTAMGGLADPSRPLPRPVLRVRPQPVADPATRARLLGFTDEAGVLVRRVRVDLGPFLERAGATLPATPADLVRLLYRLPAGAPAGPFAEADALVLDIETLGLRGSGVVPFLVGLGAPRGASLEIDQYLLADLEAEGQMLDAIAARLAGCRVLLTYNGRGFDVPVLRARCIINRRPADAISPAIHCDLLGPVRRLFRERLGSCTLRQAELSLLGLDRGDDVPGAEAPARFRAWLGGAPPSVLEGVIRHNQLDLCATAVLGSRLAAHAAGRMVEPVHPADRYRLGVHLDSIGFAGAAGAQLLAAFEDASSPWSRPAGHRLARHLGRGMPKRRAEVLGELCRRHPDDLIAARGLAIALERSGDLGGALAVCAEAEAALRARSAWRHRLSLGPPPGGGPEAEWRRRTDRLLRRQARRGTAAAAALPLLGSA